MSDLPFPCKKPSQMFHYCCPGSTQTSLHLWIPQHSRSGQGKKDGPLAEWTSCSNHWASPPWNRRASGTFCWSRTAVDTLYTVEQPSTSCPTYVCPPEYKSMWTLAQRYIGRWRTSPGAQTHSRLGSANWPLSEGHRGLSEALCRLNWCAAVCAKEVNSKQTNKNEGDVVCPAW